MYNPCPPPPPPPPLQALRSARSRVSEGQLLPRSATAGGGVVHGTRFWEAVARRMPGRPAADCLDAYVAARLSVAVARFHAPKPSQPYL